MSGVLVAEGDLAERVEAGITPLHQIGGDGGERVRGMAESACDALLDLRQMAVEAPTLVDAHGDQIGEVADRVLSGQPSAEIDRGGHEAVRLPGIPVQHRLERGQQDGEERDAPVTRQPPGPVDGFLRELDDVGAATPRSSGRSRPVQREAQHLIRAGAGSRPVLTHVGRLGANGFLRDRGVKV
jgi:hypothetical protein